MNAKGLARGYATVVQRRLHAAYDCGSGARLSNLLMTAKSWATFPKLGPVWVGTASSSDREAVVDAPLGLGISQRLLHLPQPSLVHVSVAERNDCLLWASVRMAPGGQGRQPLHCCSSPAGIERQFLAEKLSGGILG